MDTRAGSQTRLRSRGGTVSAAGTEKGTVCPCGRCLPAASCFHNVPTKEASTTRHLWSVMPRRGTGSEARVWGTSGGGRAGSRNCYRRTQGHPSAQGWPGAGLYAPDDVHGHEADHGQRQVVTADVPAPPEGFHGRHVCDPAPAAGPLLGGQHSPGCVPAPLFPQVPRACITRPREGRTWCPSPRLKSKQTAFDVPLMAALSPLLAQVAQQVQVRRMDAGFGAPGCTPDRPCVLCRRKKRRWRAT